MILKKYIYTGHKARKNIDVEVFTNQRIYLRLKILGNSLL